jgi:hypothetical protein
MPRKKEAKEMTLEYAQGYRDALEDIWEEVLKMATKGYSSQEMQIVAKSKAYSSKKSMDKEITELEAVQAQSGIIDAEVGLPPELAGLEDAQPVIIPDMKPGFSYLVKESKPSLCFQIFEKEMTGERPGLCIARTTPSLIREKYNIGGAQILWLTRRKKEDVQLPPSSLGLGIDLSEEEDYDDEYIGPNNLPKLFSIIANFLGGHQGGVVVLEGIEYLITHNKFKSVLNFLQSMNEHIATSSANLIMPINPTTLDEREYSLLEREMSHVI